MGRWFRALAGSVGPGSGSVVMATGIVSVVLLIDGDLWLSRVLFALAGATWIGLALLFAWRVAFDPVRFRAEAGSAAGLTGVAATAVLGSRFLDLGWPGLGAALLVLAGGLWVVLMPLVLRSLPSRASGGLFMLTVSTQALAVLSAALAAPDHSPFLEYLALPLTGLGLGLYAIVLARLDLRELRDGRGDQWICGGALAITTLAGAQITLSAGRLHLLDGGGQALQDLTLGLWAAAALWLPFVLAGELWRPRILYHARRWATVFPLGMYAVCSSTAGAATGLGWLAEFGRVWTWIAAAGWALTAAGLLRQGRLWWMGVSRSLSGSPADGAAPSSSVSPAQARATRR